MARGQSNQEPLTEAQMQQEEKSLKAILAAMPKKKLLIPHDPNNPDDVVPIGWNGVIYAVPRGIEFEVPEVIADLWNNHYTQTIATQQRMNKITRNKDIEVLF
jgi:hypothetical protein